MSLLRFGVAMEKELVDQLDRFVCQEGFANRSEALRSLVRRALTEERPNTPESGGPVALSGGVLTLVYPAQQKLDRVPTAPYSSLHIQANLQLHVDPTSVLKILVLRGKAVEIRDWSNHLIRQKGVVGNLGLMDTTTLAQSFGKNPPEDSHE